MPALELNKEEIEQILLDWFVLLEEQDFDSIDFPNGFEAKLKEHQKQTGKCLEYDFLWDIVAEKHKQRSGNECNGLALKEYMEENVSEGNQYMDAIYDRMYAFECDAGRGRRYTTILVKDDAMEEPCDDDDDDDTDEHMMSDDDLQLNRKCGLIFPVARMQKQLEEFFQEDEEDDSTRPMEIDPSAGIMLAAISEYLVGEVMELAGNQALDHMRKHINSMDICYAIANDNESGDGLRDCFVDEEECEDASGEVHPTTAIADEPSQEPRPIPAPSGDSLKLPPSPASASSELFDSPPTPSDGLLGAPTPMATAGESLFGSSSGGNPFGNSTPAPAPAVSFLGSTSPAQAFGTSDTTSLFGGTPVPPSGNIFGSSAPGGSLFGKPTPAVAAGKSIFGSSDATSSMFGASAPSSSADSIFGSSAPASGGFSFGAATPGKSIFGSSGGTTSLFGAPAASSDGDFDSSVPFTPMLRKIKPPIPSSIVDASSGRTRMDVYWRTTDRFPGGNCDIFTVRYRLMFDANTSGTKVHRISWRNYDDQQSIESGYIAQERSSSIISKFEKLDWRSAVIRLHQSLPTTYTGMRSTGSFFHILDEKSSDNNAYDTEWSSTEILVYNNDDSNPFLRLARKAIMGLQYSPNNGDHNFLKEGTQQQRALIDMVTTAIGMGRPEEFSSSESPAGSDQGRVHTLPAGIPYAVRPEFFLY